MRVRMLLRRKVKRGFCIVLGCYAIFLLFNLIAWSGGKDEDSGDLIVNMERHGRAALSNHQHDDSDKDEETNDSESHDRPLVMLPETLDKVIKQQPGAPAARKKLSKPEPQHVNVIVEDAPPGTFVKHAIQPESNSNFQDLRDVPDENVHPLERLKAMKEQKLNGLRAIRRGGKVQIMDSPGRRLPAVQRSAGEKRDSDVHDHDPNEKDSAETRKGEGSWLAPDDAPDDLKQINTDDLPQASPDKQSAQQPPNEPQGSAQFLQATAMLNISVSPLAANFKELSDVTIYSAFYDDRLSVPLVRMLAVRPINRRTPADALWCIFSSQSVEPVQVSFHQTTDCKRTKKYCFFLLHCQVPEGVLFTSSGAANSVLVVVGKRENNFLNQSGERVHLHVIVNQKASTKPLASSTASGQSALFSVCVPPLFGKINVLQFVEFVELNRLLGAVHFTFYKFRVSREISRVLTFYQDAGVVTVLPWDLPAPNDIRYKGQSIATGDCLFRNMHLFDYVTFQDLDEFFVPRKASSWKGLLRFIHAQSNSADSRAAVYEMLPVMFYAAETGKAAASFMQSEASRFLTLRSTFRGNTSNSNLTKLLVRPERVLELDVNRLIRPISEVFSSYKVDPRLASVHHYRHETCSGSETSAANCVGLWEDVTMWQYKTVLVERTKSVLQQLNRLGPSLT